MRRRDVLALPLGLALPDGTTVSLLMRVSDGSLVSGDSALARTWILSPGSTCKPFVFQALLQARRLKPAETFLCPGQLRVGPHNLACSHPRGLPPLDVPQMIAYSCNCATAHFAAQRSSPNELAAALRPYGFRVDLVDVQLMALGEEGVLVTPFDLANSYRRLANTAVPEVRAGLEGAVQFGTAQRAAVTGLHVAGKTGTVVTSTGLHAALFAGFAPASAPEYIAAIVTQGRSGGADAAPLAAELFHRQLTTKKTASGEQLYRVRVGQVISSFTVEEYVAAVLAGESSVFRHPEALKAMSIAVRTYAANQKGRHAKEGFDFCNTTHCQRAEPSSVTPNLTQAALATQREMLRFHNSAAFTPYTMNCGGMSESGAAVWPGLSTPYLRVHHDDYCEPIAWAHEISLLDIEIALREAGLRCPEHLQTISILNRTGSGRVRQLSLDGDSRETISAGAFRFAIGRSLGWNIVRSGCFEISLNTSAVARIQGKGEGHGVGLCQRGAEAMAARAFTYRDILAFYYPGISSAEWTRMAGEGITLYVTDPARDGIVLAEAEKLAARLPWPVDRTIEIYLHPSLDEFRNATHEPGWVAARTEGNRIDLQPKQVLDSRGILRSTLHHELLHVAVETRAAPGLPVWFREGVVEWLAGNRHTQDVATPSDVGLRDRQNQQRAADAYRTASAKVTQLVDRYGEATVLGWIEKGLPEAVQNSTAITPTTKSR